MARTGCKHGRESMSCSVERAKSGSRCGHWIPSSLSHPKPLLMKAHRAYTTTTPFILDLETQKNLSPPPSIPLQVPRSARTNLSLIIPTSMYASRHLFALVPIKHIVGTLAYFHTKNAIKSSAFLLPSSGWCFHNHLTLRLSHVMYPMNEWVGIRELQRLAARSRTGHSRRPPAFEAQGLVFKTNAS
ncbi:hypothetical protein BKA70DRAFT_98849 [Coprinopsis sp. MPI-PUGE-AT-0042]|nr:hypothetical protein BKA70DRAFT_98849 [Coprinopsis sp. MPI-PUGE-AT-0042]